jgi:hypothetical protein
MTLFMSGRGGSVSNISYFVYAAGVSLVNCYLGIYNMAGNQVGGSSPDQSANMMAIGAHTATLATPAALASGTTYRVGIVMGAVGTGCTFAGYAANSAVFTNMGIPAGKQLFCQIGAGYTALPPTYVPGSVGSIAGGIAYVMS